MKRKHLIMELLHRRAGIDVKSLERERKGVSGEKMVRELVDEKMVLEDVTLEIDGSIIQLDFVVIAEGRVTVLEVKHHSRDYVIRENSWYFNDGQKASNPFYQLERARGLMEKYLRQRGFRVPGWGFIVWTNSESHVFGLKQDDPFMTPGKLVRYMRENPFRANLELREMIERDRILVSPFDKIELDAAGLAPGLHCLKCFSLDVKRTRKTVLCTKCQFSVCTLEAVKAHLVFYCLLYDRESFQIKDIMTFTGGLISLRTMQTCIGQMVEAEILRRIHRTEFQLLHINELIREMKD
ncbi:nuclease-related domain-containing protein [Macrococcus brunensis]|uniref:nuclease-related domain-containing protein n=1 Tax=Macrococcus brunensis TaxID=198483 RepID=UPI001EF10B17|nr:nuclease-related domain-containing protein [Macrococcus brunensis]ULG71197.1 NERD domain-containing protein [Macrococcus brunensis]